jgi:uncharacterized protein
MSVEYVSTIQAIYEAFGRGDVATILARVRPDTHWDFAGGSPEVAWHLPVNGATELPGFFKALSDNVAIERFEPREFVHCGPHVMVDVHIAYVVRKTGVRVEMDQIHWWTLDDGKILRLRHYEDTAQVVAANRWPLRFISSSGFSNAT